MTETGLIPYNLLRDHQCIIFHFYHEDWAVDIYNPRNPYRLIANIIRAKKYDQRTKKELERIERLKNKIRDVANRIAFFEEKKQKLAKRKSKKLHLYLDKVTKYE